MSRVLMPQHKKFQKNIRSTKNYSQQNVFDHLEPIEEEESSKSNIENSSTNINSEEPLGNVTIEQIFFKENPFRVCGYMKVTDMNMALNVQMSMQFTGNFWQSFVESPIICRPKYDNVIEFDVEIPEIMFQTSNMDFRVCSKVLNS
uniref:Uncharacterized protein n=1 Tax=Acrobeloides nanus TaxID=290746 RepID=A0A914C3V6_9BILA